MSDEQSSHPLYQTPQGQHPLSDRPPDDGQPQGIRIPIPLNAQFPILTYTLIALNVAIFVVRYFAPDLSNQILIAGYTDVHTVIREGQYYRLLTSMFLHFNEAHMLFNGIALYYIGSHIERLFGRIRFALVYFLGGLVGSILPLFFDGGGLGASGAVFAIWAAEAVFLYQHRTIFGTEGRARLRSSLMLMLVNFIAGFTANTLASVSDSPIRIGNAAHFGGLIGGAIITWFIAPKFIVRRKAQAEEGDVAVEIIQGNRLQDNVKEILGICVGLLLILLFVILLRS